MFQQATEIFSSDKINLFFYILIKDNQFNFY